jgi:basic amino acid/polyamine antiporter, APA family
MLMASERTAVPQAHFARRATGFVRDVKVRDAVIFNVLPACPGLVMALSIFWVLSSFSQVNVYVAILITALCSFAISGAFGLLSQIMPRSGADYILISRSLHPALAIGSSILIGTSSMIAMGYWGVFTAKICVGPMLTMVGVASNSHTLTSWGTTVTSNGWSMAIGFIEIALLALIMAYGMRLMMRIQLWLFGLGMLGFVAAALTLLFTSRSSFIGSYNTYAKPFTHKADTYHYFIQKAQAAGVNLSGGTNWHNTIVASGAFIAFGVWVWFSTNLAGEIRQAGTRKNWYSMLGGLAGTFIPILIMVALLYHTVGQTFLTAVNGVSGDPSVYTLPNGPWWITLVAAIHTNTLFVAFLGITFVAWAPLIVYIQIVQPVRALFAWSFDQVIPEKVASINERTHTPVFTLAVITIASIPFLYMAAYSANFLKVVALSTIVGFPTFVLVGVSAILFPYRRRAAYEASVSNISLLGVPLLVYFGIGSIVAGLFGGWLWFAYPTLGLPRAGDGLAAQLFTSPFRGGLALVAADLIVGALIYYAGKAWRASQGIDLSLNYLEIPPE